MFDLQPQGLRFVSLQGWRNEEDAWGRQTIGEFIKWARVLTTNKNDRSTPQETWWSIQILV